MADYNDALGEMQSLSPDAVTKFKAHNPTVFCRAFMQTSVKSDVITSNLAETFNNWIMKARVQHMINMIEEIGVMLMKRMFMKRQEIEKSSAMFGARIGKKIEKEKEDIGNCFVIPSTSSVFQVNHDMQTQFCNGGNRFQNLIVNLDAKTCTCRKWDMTGIPCCHAMAAIYFLKKQPEDFVDYLYTRDAYFRSYSESIPPLVSDNHWPIVNFPLDPPPMKVGPGRPRKNRIKDPYEDPKKPGKLTRHGMQMTCSICNTTGHNKRKCPNKDNVNQCEPKKAKMSDRAEVASTTVASVLEQSQREQSITFNHVNVVDTATLARGRGSGANRGRGRGRGSGATRGRGRSNRASSSNQHHEATAEPSRTGKGNRVISSSKGRAKKTPQQKNKIPQGFGVFQTPDGYFMNEPGQHGGPKNVSQSSMQAVPVHYGTQGSSTHLNSQQQ